MRLLVLGGTVFLSRAVAVDAVARGHEVVIVTRGLSGPPPEGVRHVVADRAGPLPGALAAQEFDAVVDVACTPSHVRRAVAAWPRAHWVFVSTVNAYADDATAGQSPATGRARPPRHDDADLAAEPEAYGPMKVACEEIVRAGTASSAVVRPGLIAGPGDPTGRFTYWPWRLGRAGAGSRVLAPDPAASMQVIDVRDLAAWLVSLAVGRTPGTFDGVGPVTTIGGLLADVADGVGCDPAWRWASDGELDAAGVVPWAGERSLPLWLPRPQFDGLPAHDATPSLAGGLTVRPMAETARDTLAWLRATPGAVVCGLAPAEETSVLADLDRPRAPIDD